MIKSFGIDIIENKRFESRINDEKFIKRILSPKEIAVYKKINHPNRQMEYLASRFSVKESLIKALDNQLDRFNYCDISVLNKESGAPYIEVNYDIKGDILVSISHASEYTITQVIIQNPQ